MLALLLALAEPDPAQTDMPAQFKAGQWLCSDPDPQTRTCTNIDRLSVRADGTVFETGEVLAAPDQPISVETTELAQITAGAVCTTLDMADVQKAIVRVNGSALPPDRAAPVVAKIVAAFQTLAGKTLCESLRLDDGKLVKIAHSDQLDLSFPPKPVSWISPADGYRVAPRLP